MSRNSQLTMAKVRSTFPAGSRFSAGRAVALTLLALLVILGWSQQMSALSSIPSRNTWITNGTVSTIVTTDTTVYLGGAFTYVGPNSGSGTPLNASTGAPVSTYPKVDGGVLAVVSDGVGGWYIGGDFMRVGALERNRIAHILADGSVDDSWNPNANSIVMTLAVSGSTVYAGGFFTSIGGQPRNFIAALDAATGNATSWDPGANLPLYALAVSGSSVYAGGDFTSIGGQPRNRIAALDAATGSAATWDPGANLTVYALAVSGSTVYAGGDFTSIGGQPRNFIAALDAATGNAADWNPGANQPVDALAVSGSTVYAGGFFTSIGGQPRNYIAALDAATGNTAAWNPNANLTVYALAVNGSTVYAGGDFTSIGGQPRNYIAALDAATGNAAAWNPNADQTVSALAVTGSTIYAGGYFSSIGRQRRNHIAALDAVSGQATSWNPNADGTVSALAVSGSTVYAGGEFAAIGGTARNHLAALDAATGSATSWDPDADGTVKALAVSGTMVYAGGEFAAIGGATRNHLAALDATTGNAAAWNPNPNGLVNALVMSGSTLYAGGDFTTIGAQSTQPLRNHIAALDTATGHATSWNPNADGLVRALAVSGSTVYAGGDFTKIGGVNQSFIGALDAATGDATAWDPNADATIRTLLVNESTVYAGGDFSVIGGQSRNYMAALETLTALATPWDPNAGFSVHTLAATANDLYAGGEFLSMGGEAQPYLAQFRMGFSVSGTVTSGGGGLSGVAITLTGAASKGTITDGSGHYHLSALSDGTYTITPGKAGYAFTPQERELTVAGGDVTGQDFAVSATVPGAPTEVTASAGNGQATVSFTPPASDGGSPITSYTVTSSPGGLTAAGAGSPLTVTGLTNGTAYTFTVTASNAVGTGAASSPSNSVTPAGPFAVPDAPTGVSATAGNARAIVSFTAPPSDGGSPILSYKVISTPGGKTAKGTSSPITVKGLTNGTAYTFKVRATNAVGTGPASSPSNSVTPVTVPGAPTGVTATAGNTQATVSFTPPTSDGGSPILSYKVTANPGGKTAKGTSSPITVKGLTNGTAYTFTVRATNAIGTGPASAPSNSIIPALKVPGAPTGVTATAGHGQATVAFTAPASDGGSPITSYTVTSNPGGQTATGKSSPITVKGLTNGTSYTFTVKATNAIGTGPASTPSNSVTPGYTISGTVTSWGSGLSGVAVNLTGTATGSTTTDSNGKYSFTGLANGDYTITPSKDGYTVKPLSKSAKINNGNASGKDFVASPIVSGNSVAGTVTTGDGLPLPTVVMTLSATATDSVTTDSYGDYLFTGVADGQYMLTPSRIGYDFAPPSRTIVVSSEDVSGQDFTATFTGYSLSGRITSGGFGVAGVTVNLSGGRTESTTTDSDGVYTLSGLAGGTYTVTPGTPGYTLHPQNRSVQVHDTDVLREDFAASLEESISLAMSAVDAPEASQRLHVYGSLPVENEFIDTLFPEIAALVAAGSMAVPEIVPKFAGYPSFSQDSALVVYARVLLKIGDQSAVSALADFLENNLTGDVFASLHAATHALKTLTGQKDPHNGTFSYRAEEVMDTVEQARKWLGEHPEAAQLGEFPSTGPLGTPPPHMCYLGVFLTDQNGTALQYTNPGWAVENIYFELNIYRDLGWPFDADQNASICGGGGVYVTGEEDEGDMTKKGRFAICGGYTLREALKFRLGKKSESQVPKWGWNLNPGEVYRALSWGKLIEPISESAAKEKDLVFWVPHPGYAPHSAHIVEKTTKKVDGRDEVSIRVKNKDYRSGVFTADWQSKHYNTPKGWPKDNHYGKAIIHRFTKKFNKINPTFKVDTSKWNYGEFATEKNVYCKNLALRIKGVKKLSSLLLTVTGDGFPAAGADSGKFEVPLNLFAKPKVAAWVDPPDNNTIQVPLILPLGKKKIKAEVKDSQTGATAATEPKEFELNNSHFLNAKPVNLEIDRHSISGTVKRQGVPLKDVSVLLTGVSWTMSKTVTTDDDGKYAFPELLDGNYTIFPSKDQCRFDPVNPRVMVNKKDRTQNFTAACGYSIRGRVTVDGKPLGEVAVNLKDVSGKVPPQNTTTDGDGNYSFPEIPDGRYTITPSMAGYTFDPAGSDVSVTGQDALQDFFATLVTTTYAITGQVTTGGSPLKEVTMALTGPNGLQKSTTTAASGFYVFAGLPNGTYTIKPTEARYTFDPASKEVPVNGQDATQDFTATLITYSITGHVKYADTSPVPGVTIALSGAATDSKLTESSGSYAFSGLSSGSYTLTPQEEGCDFDPKSRTFTLNNEHVSGQDFTATCGGSMYIHYRIYYGEEWKDGDLPGLQGTIPIDGYKYEWAGGYANMSGSVVITQASETPSECSYWAQPSLKIDATATWNNQGLGYCRNTGIFHDCDDTDEGTCTTNDNDKGCVTDGSFSASLSCTGCCLNYIYFYGFNNWSVWLTLREK